MTWFKLLSRLLGLIVLGICFNGCASSESTPPIRKARVLQVHAQEYYPTWMFPGRSRPAKSVNLAFGLNGQLIDLKAQVGQEVKRGDVLAQLDPRDFQFQVKSIEGNILQTEAALRLAEAEFVRFNNLLQRDPGAVSVILVKQKEETVNSLIGQLKTVNASLQTAKRALDDTLLKAPFNGTIVAVFADNFEQVNASQLIVRLVSTEEIEVVIDVPDRIISSVKDAKNIHVQFDAVPGIRFPATIEEVGTEASQTTRTFPVTLLVVPPENIYLFPGMTGAVYLEKSRGHEDQSTTFKLPISALLSSDGTSSIVWVADPATWKIVQKPVEIVTLGEQYCVVKGLSNEDWVIVSGVNFLKDEEVISPLAVRMDESGEIFQLPSSGPLADKERPTP